METGQDAHDDIVTPPGAGGKPPRRGVAFKRWKKTAKGKEYLHRNNTSEKGRATKRRYAAKESTKQNRSQKSRLLIRRRELLAKLLAPGGKDDMGLVYLNVVNELEICKAIEAGIIPRPPWTSPIAPRKPKTDAPSRPLTIAQARLSWPKKRPKKPPETNP